MREGPYTMHMNRGCQYTGLMCSHHRHTLMSLGPQLLQLMHSVRINDRTLDKCDEEWGTEKAHHMGSIVWVRLPVER